MVGRRLLHFNVLEKLGEGGMGVVYKARDTHLDRFVAIKVLPADKVADPERRRRFVQEARAASALNHPNIVTVHDITQAEGLDFIVMEHVDGKTLDALIPRPGMRLSEVLRVGAQVAGALAAAHAKGIIHRDLKPANVMVGAGGAVKVLDFGLAKLNVPAAASSETELPTGEARTGAGVILGTAAYMSPEQAEGKPLDARSDIFSFGTMLYEMATGRRAFTGDSWVSTVSAVLHQEPKPLEGLPHDLERVIQRCLRKDPAKRFQHMDDICVALEELKDESDSGKLGAVAAASRSPMRRRAAYGAAATMVLFAAAVAAWRWGVPREPVTPPRLVPLTTFPGYELHPAFSPDGKQVAFSWNGPEEENYDIYVMLLGTSTPVRLTTHAADDFGPAWSPDGRRIAFWRAGSPPSIMLMSALGGSERELAKGSTRRDGVAWSPDGKFVAYPADPETDGPARIVMVSPDTGERRALTAPPPGRHGDGVPRFSPDGKSLAFVREREDGFDELRTASLAAPLVSARLVSPTAARVYSVPFAWTRDGRGLVFSASYTGTTGLWRMPADGRTPPVPVLGVGQSPEGVDIAPTGALLAFGESLSDVNLWKLGLDGRRVRSGPSRAIASTAWDGAPDYSPDGRRVVFVSNRSGTYEIWVSDADGSNQTRVTHLAASMSGSPRWSPDGKTIAFDSQAEGQEDIYTVSADGGPAKRLTHSPSLDVVATWSRDGRWIYFTSDRSGSRQIWKMPAEGGDPVQVTRHGGVNATESIDGGTLYYARDIDAPGFCRMPVGGGNEEQFLDIPARRRWGQVALTAEGLFYLDVDGTDTSSRSAIFFHDFSTRTSTLVQRLAGPAPTHTPGLALSPDGRSLLFLQLEASGSDLKLLENFR